MIRAVVELVPNSRTSKHGALWLASLDGEAAKLTQEFRVTSRVGASHALCRALVKAGYPDQPMEVWFEGRKALMIKSIYHWATRTMIETATEPIYQKKWQEHFILRGEHD